MMIRERFIPYRRADVIKMCQVDDGLPDTDKNNFTNFCQIINSLFHFELHKRLEFLKECYAPFNPDSDTLQLASEEYSESEMKIKLENELKQVLEQANYEKVSENDMNDALNSESLFKVKLQVDFDDFEEGIIFQAWY